MEPQSSNQYKPLETPIEYLKGVGPVKADVLKKELQVFRFSDLLQHFPFRYVDRTRFFTIRELTPDSPMLQLKGRIERVDVQGEKRGKRLVAQFTDGTGTMDLVWFRSVKWMQNYLKPGQEYIIFGKPNWFNNRPNMPHPEMDPVLPEAIAPPRAALHPMYYSTEKLKLHGLDSRGLYKLIQTLFGRISEADMPEMLPPDLVEKYRLAGRFEAYRNIHLPDTQDDIRHAQRRLKFEELFLLQLQVIKLRLSRMEDHQGHIFPHPGHYLERFYSEVLPFELTTAQKRVVKEIRHDFLTGNQMNRLLQGDVGSGKTVVALMAMLMAAGNGFQAALMAPTEILAQQHYNAISADVKALGLHTVMLTGNVKGAKRKAVLQGLQSGDIHFVVGTHALIEDKVQYKHLGLVVIDEQHRFGVAQRARLWGKGIEAPPHILVMTATPIPRTLAMTLYGDLDVSVIDELPPGRKPIATKHLYDSDRLRIFGFMKEQIAQGRQIYVVYPLIQESEKLDLKDLQDGYESISRAFPLPGYAVSMLHGKMAPDAKAYEMQRFVKGETHIMVATTVIEVGVNVPNASVMVIENAERFGLAQLHQLRGRVGRGADQSYCLLVSKDKLGADARKRIKTMCSTNDGFKIAEVDMELRGPGEIEGTRQSGHLHLKMADLQTDFPILQEARNSAIALLENDPLLAQNQNAPLRHYLKAASNPGFNWGKVL